eukprot:GHVQ01010913.1.p1 GENE.GHVQ01010913.1~~GHVQ01010913.1.p1  ORF type:complete len:125 (-),score=15.90 GHVQ01010913.1:819-1193(-)
MRTCCVVMTDAVLHGLTPSVDAMSNSVDGSEVSDEAILCVVVSKEEQEQADRLPSDIPTFEEAVFSDLQTDTEVSGPKPLIQESLDSDTKWWNTYKIVYKKTLEEDRSRVELFLARGIQAIELA